MLQSLQIANLQPTIGDTSARRRVALNWIEVVQANSIWQQQNPTCYVNY